MPNVTATPAERRSGIACAGDDYAIAGQSAQRVPRPQSQSIQGDQYSHEGQ